MSSSSPLHFSQQPSTAIRRGDHQHHQHHHPNPHPQKQQQHRALDYSISNSRHVISEEPEQLTPVSKSDYSTSVTPAGCSIQSFHQQYYSLGQSLSPSFISDLLTDILSKFQRGIVDQLPRTTSVPATARQMLIPPHASLASLMPAHPQHHHHYHHRLQLPHQLGNLLHGSLPPQYVHHINPHIHHLQYLHQLQPQHPQHEEPKPTLSYIGLIAMAILGSTERKLVLSDIYQWILDHYPYFRHRGPGWRNSIRHNLSLNDCFIKAARSANGKGHYWAVHPANIEDFERGDFRRRRAQRKVRRAMGLTVLPDDNDDDLDSPAPSPAAAYFRSLSSASPGDQSAAAAAAVAAVLGSNRATATAAASWMLGCGLSPDDYNIRSGSTEVFKGNNSNGGSNSNHIHTMDLHECHRSSSWSSPEVGRPIITDRTGSTSTRRRLFDMDSLLAPDNCSSKQHSPWQPQPYTTPSQGQGQEQERDRCRFEKEIDGYEERLAADECVTVSSRHDAEDTNASWYSDKTSLSSFDDDSTGTAHQLVTLSPIN